MVKSTYVNILHIIFMLKSLVAFHESSIFIRPRFGHDFSYFFFLLLSPILVFLAFQSVWPAVNGKFSFLSAFVSNICFAFLFLFVNWHWSCYDCHHLLLALYILHWKICTYQSSLLSCVITCRHFSVTFSVRLHTAFFKPSLFQRLFTNFCWNHNFLK